MEEAPALVTASDLDWKAWSAKYDEIVERLALDPTSDRLATRMIHAANQARGGEIRTLLCRLGELVRSRTVVIFGCGPSLDSQLGRLRTILRDPQITRMAADGATSALMEAGLFPEVIVTDLDGNVPDIVSCSRRGSLVLLHAHGDNGALIRRHLGELKNVVPITQTEPTSIVRNFGGFTDGDKCVFVASAFGASRIVLIGMEFGRVIGKRSDPGQKNRLTDRKIAKLEIGRELLEGLARESHIPIYSLGPLAIGGVHEIPEESLGDFIRG